MYAALRGCRSPHKPVTVVYCDTGVEIPVVAQLVRQTLRGLASEATRDRVPLVVRTARPPILDRFFVKVIGRGYPPPTNKFRWCTDRLRIDPVRRIIGRHSEGRAVVLLGTRRGESSHRDRTLARQSLRRKYFFRQSGNANIEVFAPIVDFAVSDVWTTLFSLASPSSLDADRLALLYRAAGSDCPIIRDPQGSPCGVGRFGCWTCTVVRTDRAVSSMVTDGYSHLAPLREFRNWLATMRDDPVNRCRFRRNGSRGPGPLTLSARQEAMRRLRKAERNVPWTLLTAAEERAIRALWRADRESATYRE